MPTLRRIGKTDLEVTPIGLGCWQFSGSRNFGGLYWGGIPQEEIDAIVAGALGGGVNWFDTAEIYGGGRSETALAKSLARAGKTDDDVLVATKWWPAFRTASSIGRTIGERLRCLSPFTIDLYQVHQPIALATVKAQMDAMADLMDSKQIRAVGVSNFSERRMRAAHEALAARNLSLASNQVRYSLLDRQIERSGVLGLAKEIGASIIAYSPLAQGILTGKFHDDPKLIRSRPGPRKLLPQFQGRGLEKSRPVVDELRRIASAHGASPAQVALAWLLQIHGPSVVAIPGATKASHIEAHAGSMDLTLSEAELGKLEELSRPFL